MKYTLPFQVFFFLCFQSRSFVFIFRSCFGRREVRYSAALHRTGQGWNCFWERSNCGGDSEELGRLVVYQVSLYPFRYFYFYHFKQEVLKIIFSPNLLYRYQDKEGWAPASYLKKMKDDLSPRKKTATGPVEIIGNIMEISNLLNKKASSEKDVQIEGVPESPQVAKKEISLPIPCAESSPLNSPQDGKSKAESSSPAIARVAPHRVEIG